GRRHRGHRRWNGAGTAVKALALALVLGSTLPGTGRSQEPDTSALGPRLSLEMVVARTLAHSPGVVGAQGAVRDAAALRRVTLGAYLPTVALNSSAAPTDQSLATSGVVSSTAPVSALLASGA